MLQGKIYWFIVRLIPVKRQQLNKNVSKAQMWNDFKVQNYIKFVEHDVTLHLQLLCTRSQVTLDWKERDVTAHM